MKKYTTRNWFYTLIIGFMVAAFALVGVPREGALVLSLATGILAIVVMIPAGLMWLVGRRKGESISAAEAQEAVEEEMAHAGDESGPTA